MANIWYHHGEQLNVSKKKKLDDAYELLKAIHYEDEDYINRTFFENDNDKDDAQWREEVLHKNLEDVETSLYPGCTDQTKLSALFVLYNLNCETGLSDNSVDKLLHVQQLLLPKNNVLRKSLLN